MTEHESSTRMSVSLPYNYEHNGEMRTGWTNVGTAFVKPDGSCNIEIRPGLAVSGRLIVRPFKNDDAGDAEPPAQSQTSKAGKTKRGSAGGAGADDIPY